MTYFTPSYGNCFIFNFKRNGSNSESSVLPGPVYGLSLVLNLELENYRAGAESEGVRWEYLMKVKEVFFDTIGSAKTTNV